MWPSKKQWKKWTLPSKLTAIGTLIGIISLFITVTPYITEVTTGFKSSEKVKVSKNDLEISIFHYPYSPLSEEGETYLKNKRVAENIKEHLYGNGFYNVMISITPDKPLKTIIKHVNNVPNLMLSEINMVVSNQLPKKQMSAIIVERPAASVGFEHPSVSITLGHIKGSFKGFGG